MGKYPHDLEMCDTTSAMRKDSRSAVAANVRAELARRHLTHRALADHLQKSPPYVSRRLAGELSFDVDELLAIADLLDVSIQQLLPAAAA